MGGHELRPCTKDAPEVPTDESAPLSVPDPLNPRYSYGGGKIISELMTINWGRKHFERAVIFRPHNVFGPDMGWEHVVPQFAVRMKALCDATPSGPIAFPRGSGGRDRGGHLDLDPRWEPSSGVKAAA